MQTILLLISLGLSWVPIGILLVSAIHNADAKRLWKALGIPSLIIFSLIWFYSWQANWPLASLIGWGIVSGIALTIALDIVRLSGVKLGTMHMDVPISFGLRATGLLQDVKKIMMARMKEMGVAQMPQELTMFGAAAMMKPVIMEVFASQKARAKVMFWGYVWHFLNGIALGVSYVLLVGSGHWLIGLGWGIVIWVLMMLVMPAMMNGAKLTPSIFLTALVAHIAMALPLMWIPPATISPAETQNTILVLISKLVGLY